MSSRTKKLLAVLGLMAMTGAPFILRRYNTDPLFDPLGLKARDIEAAYRMRMASEDCRRLCDNAMEPDEYSRSKCQRRCMSSPVSNAPSSACANVATSILRELKESGATIAHFGASEKDPTDFLVGLRGSIVSASDGLKRVDTTKAQSFLTDRKTDKQAMKLLEECKLYNQFTVGIWETDYSRSWERLEDGKIRQVVSEDI